MSGKTGQHAEKREKGDDDPFRPPMASSNILSQDQQEIIDLYHKRNKASMLLSTALIPLPLLSLAPLPFLFPISFIALLASIPIIGGKYERQMEEKIGTESSAMRNYFGELIKYSMYYSNSKTGFAISMPYFLASLLDSKNFEFSPSPGNLIAGAIALACQFFANRSSKKGDAIIEDIKHHIRNKNIKSIEGMGR